MEQVNNEQSVSVLDVLKENVKILGRLRIPIGETEIWNAIQGVSQNTQACIEAMEKADAEARSKEESTGDQHEDNVATLVLD